MSTRTDWGWFDKDGKPIAVGDEWHKWKCPQHHYEPAGYEHPFTGEWIDEGYTKVEHCRMRTTDKPKFSECSTCGNQFIYP